MAATFVTIACDTPMLLPSDLRDWVGEDDLVHFVIEEVLGFRGFMLRGEGKTAGEWGLVCLSHNIKGSKP